VKHIIMYSGGLVSFGAAKVVIDLYGRENAYALFADVKNEHPDSYRFLEESTDKLGIPLVKIEDGRDVWTLFMDQKFVGNSLVDLCSRILKRELMDKHLFAHFKPHECISHVGIDISEIHRYERLRPRKLPYYFDAPLLTTEEYEEDKKFKFKTKDLIPNWLNSLSRATCVVQVWLSQQQLLGSLCKSRFRTMAFGLEILSSRLYQL